MYASYWFIGAITLFYITFPMIYKVVSIVPVQSVLLSYVIAIGGVCLVNFVDIGIVKSLALYFARIPIFILGIVFANNNNLFERKKTILALTIICVPLLFVLPKDYQRIVYGFLSLGIVCFLPYLIDFFPQKINGVISCLGKSSFEFYLIHLFAFYHGFVKHFVVKNLQMGGVCAFVVLAIVSFFIYKIISFIQGKLKCCLV